MNRITARNTDMAAADATTTVCLSEMGNFTFKILVYSQQDSQQESCASLQ